MSLDVIEGCWNSNESHDCHSAWMWWVILCDAPHLNAKEPFFWQTLVMVIEAWNAYPNVRGPLTSLFIFLDGNRLSEKVK